MLFMRLGRKYEYTTVNILTEDAQNGFTRQKYYTQNIYLKKMLPVNLSVENFDKFNIKNTYANKLFCHLTDTAAFLVQNVDVNTMEVIVKMLRTGNLDFLGSFAGVVAQPVALGLCV